MTRSQRRSLGLALLVGGVFVLFVVTFVAATVTAFVGLVLLIFIPEIAALVGAVLLASALATRPEAEVRSHAFGRIVGLGSVVGVAVGLATLLVSTVFLAQGWSQGFTGMFGAGLGVEVGLFFEGGAGLAAGAIVGLLAATAWWIARGRKSGQTV